ncbi:acyl-CoA dehydrogenase/oxidase [Zychaea mexicana]|uniref:acyl-CoA dehydrogenase/oxidase n=1 Tax=Zychaea mexicana TaxID=64656 RepID=UPI0022FE0922|nr:acyl-CoA dehydrogenase/oxidase [Zychaea mexicana]KAI9491673.1 acyl-CoA dehydrogenase/oxidase [Zychaea mexicana]
MAATSKQLQQSTIDIEAARQKASFPVEPLTNYLYGGPEKLKKIDRYRALIANESELSKKKAPFQSRQEQLYTSIHAARRLIEIAEEQKLSGEEFFELFYYSGLSTPLALNYGAFWPVIESQGTAEQTKKWMEAAKRHAIIGCYAQTELSHGSNVVGLQTTATFDEATDEFIINSPDITAAKWWIGGLGVASTHSVLQAQLIIKGKNYGPHIFIVPVRSPIDYKPVKGVSVGDIGPKAYGGFSTTDNGYAMFAHVRIPRDNMLMKFAKVSKAGEYTAPVHSKLSYGSMVKLRVGILSDAGWRLAKASTIAVRYCTARRQFNAGKDGLEAQVISYSSVRHRLYPLIATSYALILSGMGLSKTFNVMTQQLAREDATLLPEMHVSSCAFKVWSARRSSEGLEESRKAMGGHGYSIFSGVSEHFANFVPANTYEGDNFVLCQQVGRALLKQLSNIVTGKPLFLKSASYMELLKSNPTVTVDAASLLNPDVQLTLFGLRSARLVANLGRQIQEAGRPWEDLNMECWDICFAHAEYLLLKQFVDTVQEFAKSPQRAALAPVIKKLSDLVNDRVYTSISGGV